LQCEYDLEVPEVCIRIEHDEEVLVEQEDRELATEDEVYP